VLGDEINKFNLKTKLLLRKLNIKKTEKKRRKLCYFKKINKSYKKQIKSVLEDEIRKK